MSLPSHNSSTPLSISLSQAPISHPESSPLSSYNTCPPASPASLNQTGDRGPGGDLESVGVSEEIPTEPITFARMLKRIAGAVADVFKTGRKSFCLLHKIFYEFILFISSGPARLMPAFGPQTEGLARAVVQIWDSCQLVKNSEEDLIQLLKTRENAQRCINVQGVSLGSTAETVELKPYVDDFNTEIKEIDDFLVEYSQLSWWEKYLWRTHVQRKHIRYRVKFTDARETLTLAIEAFNAVRARNAGHEIQGDTAASQNVVNQNVQGAHDALLEPAMPSEQPGHSAVDPAGPSASPAKNYDSTQHDAASPVVIGEALDLERTSIDGGIDVHHLTLGGKRPPPVAQNMQDEDGRVYRTYLQHNLDIDDSLRYALWSPSPINVGTVGYHKADSGEFVSLFNCLEHSDTASDQAGSIKIPGIDQYGDTPNTLINEVVCKHNPARRQPESSLSSRRYSLSKHCGYKAAYLLADSLNYEFLDDHSTLAKWFKDNVDSILEKYQQHNISKQDLCVVVRTLVAKKYALFVDHVRHRKGPVHFNVFSEDTAVGSCRKCQGSFSFGSSRPPFVRSESEYESDSAIGDQCAQKISSRKSDDDGEMDCLLLAQLGFKPGSIEPMLL